MHCTATIDHGKWSLYNIIVYMVSHITHKYSWFAEGGFVVIADLSALSIFL